jgi:GNAT superfamily N-acetyltransferase
LPSSRRSKGRGLARVELRPATDADRDFLFRLYASTREEELRLVDWTDERKETFLRQQFAAQDLHYRENYPGAQRDIILIAGQPAGRLYIHRGSDEIRLMDIALVPEFRGAGLGTQLIQDVLAEGERVGKPVTIHVEVFNPARRLYERLGFTNKVDKGVYWLMEWRRDAHGL